MACAVESFEFENVMENPRICVYAWYLVENIRSHGNGNHYMYTLSVCVCVVYTIQAHWEKYLWALQKLAAAYLLFEMGKEKKK